MKKYIYTLDYLSRIPETKEHFFKYRRKINYNSLFICLLIILLPIVKIHADGSKDLYPVGLSAYRAFLRSTSNTNAATTVNWPFANRGTHYVFARVGERIALASSAQSGTNNNILLYGPTGTQITLTKSSGDGNIFNRAAELAGPALYNVAPSGSRYKAIYHSVQTEGIYRVEFLSQGTADPNETVNADGNWGNTNSSSSGIAAWDISVINPSNSGFVSGRVYTNVLNLSTGISSPTWNGFRGIVYVRTKDGYTYRVNNNGSNGMYFTFFVNNNGFVDITTQLPIYKSLNSSAVNYLNGRVHNPNNADKDTHLTHKIFYRLPDINLPPTAPVPVTSSGGTGASGWSAGTTWLKAEPVIPGVSTPMVRGSDGLIGQVSNKGGYIEFETDVQGNYTIEIISTGTPAFVNRTITGQASAGTNKVFWDGKDGNNNPLPAGTVPAKVTVQLQGAEVHFPFFDVEYNSTGIIIELLAHASLPSIVSSSDIVYWNDTDVTSSAPSNPKNNSHLPPTNSMGISSNSNGHKWGNNFGNEKSIDTWTFITGEKKEVVTNVNVKIADLKISSITADKGPVRIGDEVTYTIKAKNDGPSDVFGAPFSFILPEGFEKTGTPIFTGAGCGSESIALTYDATTNKYTSSLNLPNGCEITYTIKTIITESSTQGSKIATATILRPNDVTDPDATNQSDPNDPTNYVPPTDPFYECEHNGLSVACNNIKTNTVSLIRKSDLQIEKTVSESIPEVGEVVTFTLKVTNNGPHTGANILITDIVPSGYTIKTINNSGINTNGTIKWTIASLAKDAYTTVSFTATVLASGNYVNTASVTGDGEDPDPTNNTDTATANPCQEETIFFEDFGTSDKSVNFGRTTSPYMPSGSFTLGTPYPETDDYNLYAIDNNHYAVVAPGYIKLGHREYQYYFWTPAYNESNTVQDRSGTENGAVMVINAGQTKKSFYKRQQLLQVGASYRASLWLYLVNGPSQIAIDIRHPKTGEVLATVKSDEYQDWDSSVKHKWSYLELYFTVPVPDDEENCKVDNVVLSYRNDKSENQGNDYYIDDIRLEKVCTVPSGTIIIRCPDPNYKNLWYGTTDNDWAKEINWTAEVIPSSGEDIEFATNVNNGTTGNGKGTAIRDLHLDTDRIVGDLINNSDMNLVVTAENQLTINGTVHDDNASKGTIVVKTDPDKVSGTLLFSDPSKNSQVNATVEFYNKAYECATCGFYRKQWQYFGIPVQSSVFPYQNPQVETVNQWIEPYNGDKWRSAPYAPDTKLKAFYGYEMTNSSNTEPTHIYSFPGILNVGSANVAVTKSPNVNYAGMNLIGNSFAAAIPITSAAISLGNVELESNTVYLFNMGTRDQWRKLNGGTTAGIAAGQYQSVPFNLAGQAGIPDRILSMHTFMLDVKTPGNITLEYGELVKNELNQSTTLPWKSAELRSSTNIELPHIVIDVIAEGSADRVWLFEQADATTGFDNGWDGYKIKEGDLIQAYVAGSDQSDYQIATVGEIPGTIIGVKGESQGSYSVNLSVSPDIELRKLYLEDLLTGRTYPVVNNAEYAISGSNASAANRFKITDSATALIGDITGSSLLNIYVSDNVIVVDNQSQEECAASVYDLSGRLVAGKQVPSGAVVGFTEISQVRAGVYIVKVVGKAKSVHKTDRVLLK